jgi:hypothetical protein
MTDIPVPINWVHYSLQDLKNPPWVWVRSDSFEDTDEPEIRVFTSWEETISSFILLVDEYALKSEQGFPSIDVAVGSIEYVNKKWVFTVNNEEGGNLVIADNLHKGNKFDANSIADAILEHPIDQWEDTSTPITLRELLEMPWDAVQPILYPPADPPDESVGSARMQPECRTIVNMWGSDSSDHDFFIFAYPLT